MAIKRKRTQQWNQGVLTKQTSVLLVSKSLSRFPEGTLKFG